MPDRLIKARDLIYEMVFSEGATTLKCLAQQKFQLRLPRSHVNDSFVSQLPPYLNSPEQKASPSEESEQGSRIMGESWISLRSNLDDSLFLVDDYKSHLRQKIAKGSNSSSDRILRALESLLNNFGNDKVDQKSVASDVEDLAREMDMVFEDISGYEERNALQRDMNQSQFLREVDGAFASMSPKRAVHARGSSFPTMSSFLQLSPEPLINDARSPHVMFGSSHEGSSPNLSASEFDGDTFDDLLFEGPNNLSMRLGMSAVKVSAAMPHLHNDMSSSSHDGIASVIRSNIFADLPSSKENGSEVEVPATSKQVESRDCPVPDPQQSRAGPVGRKRKQSGTPSSPLAPASPSPPRRAPVVISPTNRSSGAYGGVRVMR
jgi:hypothetical protein